MIYQLMTIDLADPRAQRALVISADAGQWAKCILADGSKAYGVPSSSDPTVRYLVTQRSCSCPDASRNGRRCKHQLAVALHCALVKAVQLESKPERDVFDRFKGE